MNKIKIFLVLTGYQLTWLSCIFGQNKFNEPLLGMYVGIPYLILFFYFNNNKINFLKVSLCISIPGYFFDTLMVYLSIYEFNISPKFGTLPIWMLVLWISFSTLFDEILRIFKKYKIAGIFLSAVLGPLTYYLGSPLGLVNINNIFLFFILMITFWGLLMLYYIEVLIKDYSVS